MNAHTVRFGTFELDHATGELRSQGKRIPLQDQPAQLLRLLVSRPGEVVTRDELRRALWTEDTFVDFDTALNVAVNKVRQALRDSATSPRFVETVPKHGYRFLADVRTVPPEGADAAPPDAPPRAPPRSRATAWTAVSAVAAVLIAGAFALPDRACGRTALTATRSVAVLPFKPLVADARDEALELGMAEAVIVKLGQRQGLRVPSLSAVRRYAGPGNNPLQAGRELGVETVLDGSLRRADDRLRVSARLLDVDSGTTRWARQWDIPWTDVFAVEDALATEVARALAPALDAGERVPAVRPPTNAAAYDRYLRGRYLVTRRTLADSQRAAELLEEAVALDPGSAAAQAVLADAYVAVAWMGGPMEPLERARRAARRALELDPNEATAHATLGIVLGLFDWDTASGERELQRALELGPQEPAVLRFNSVFLWHEGRFEEASAMNARELALDPTSVFANRNKAIILYYARRYEDCIAQSLKTLELDRYFATVYVWLGSAYEQLGREREAVDAYIMPLTFGEEQQKEAAALRAAAAQGGLRGFWACRLAQARQRPASDRAGLALASLKVGDRAQAIAALEQLIELRGPFARTLKIDPQWDPLRADPRFQAVLRKAKLVTP